MPGEADGAPQREPSEPPDSAPALERPRSWSPAIRALTMANTRAGEASCYRIAYVTNVSREPTTTWAPANDRCLTNAFLHRLLFSPLTFYPPRQPASASVQPHDAQHTVLGTARRVTLDEQCTANDEHGAYIMTDTSLSSARPGNEWEWSGAAGLAHGLACRTTRTGDTVACADMLRVPFPFCHFRCGSQPYVSPLALSFNEPHESCTISGTVAPKLDVRELWRSVCTSVSRRQSGRII